MDLQKEREAFEAWFESRYDAHFMQFALDLDMYADKHTQTSWETWQAAKAQAVPKWISVEDSLPEFDVPVLATNMNFERGKYWWVFERYADNDFGWVWSRFESSLDEAYCDDYEITHWMPLPEPPTKECE